MIFFFHFDWRSVPLRTSAMITTPIFRFDNFTLFLASMRRIVVSFIIVTLALSMRFQRRSWKFAVANIKIFAFC